MDQQGLIWQGQGSAYAELGYALLERETRFLAYAENQDPDWFRARLSSLPFYVKKAVNAMVNARSPLTLDLQNGQWQAKQQKQLPHTLFEQEVHAWLSKFITPGVILPLLVQENDTYCVCLDSVDRCSPDRFRCNRWGWFDYHGQSCGHHTAVRVLKPVKSTMTMACCGHQWSLKSKLAPRILPLRELLLSCSVNWKNFSRPLLGDK